jgi:hypothetical protein
MQSNGLAEGECWKISAQTHDQQGALLPGQQAEMSMPDDTARLGESYSTA